MPITAPEHRLAGAGSNLESGKACVRALGLAALIVATSCTAPPDSASSPNALAITGATVIDATGTPPRADMTVVVRGGRIETVGPAGAVDVPRRARVIDAEGQYLIPGLWDTHAHLSFTGPEALPLFVANGVTAVRDVGGRLEDVRAMQERIREGETTGPRVWTSGPILEGAAWMKAAETVLPPDDPLWRLMPRVVVSKENVRAVVDSLVAEGVDLVKARNVWGEDFLALAAATEAADVLLASHNPNRVSMVESARAGLDSYEHAESVWGDFDTLGVAERSRMYEQVAELEVPVVPTLMAEVGYRAPEDSIRAAITDTLGRIAPRNRALPESMRSHWAQAIEIRKRHQLPDEDPIQEIADEVRTMDRAGIPMMAGTDVGAIPLVYPGSSLHEEMELLVHEAGLTPMEALQSATRNPPGFFRRRDEMGTIEPGKLSDLVLLDANPLEDIGNIREISAVVLRGRYLDRQALDELRAEARTPR